jgi:cardiolipin synthase A/B
MRLELLVNFEQFWARLKDDLATAQSSVWIQTFAFEGDTVGQRLAAALASSRAAEKRILADSFTRIVLSDRFRYSPRNYLAKELNDEARETAAMATRLRAAGVQIKFTNPYGLTPRKLLSRNHKKLVLLDERVAYVGGINFSEHNASWHDMMLRIEDGDLGAFVSRDFQSSWEGRDQAAQEKFEGIELLALDGRTNRAGFEHALKLIDGARQTIFVESPYITFPFYERLRNAAHRGVTVRIVTPEQNNWRFFANYARLESARSPIELRLYQNGMSHLKAMLIDDQYLIAGSSNFDYFSYRIHQELLAIITDPSLIAEFRERVMIPDLAHARSVECQASSISKLWLSWKMKLLDAAMTALT